MVYYKHYHERDGLFDDVDDSPGLWDVDGVHSLQHCQGAPLTLVEQTKELVEVHFGRVLLCMSTL